MANIKALNLALAFLVELAALVALAFWGVHTGGNALAKVGLGIGAPLLLAVFLGAFMAPRSKRHLTGITYLTVKIVIFALAALALIAADQLALGVIFGVVAILNALLAYAWKQ